MLKRGLVAVLIFQFFLVAASPSYAIEFKSSPWTSEITYNKRMSEKFLFGFHNLSLGFLEIFSEPYEAVKEDRNFWGGVGNGLFNGVVDTVGGALHILTAYATGWDIPLPEGGTTL